MLRAACVGPNTFLERRPVGLVVCGRCDEVHSLAERHLVCQQRSTYVGHQAFRQVSNSCRSISACCTGNIVLGCDMVPKLKGPICVLNISCFYSSLSNIFCAQMSKIFCNPKSTWGDPNFPNSSAFPHVCVYYNRIIHKYVKF